MFGFSLYTAEDIKLQRFVALKSPQGRPKPRPKGSANSLPVICDSFLWRLSLTLQILSTAPVPLLACYQQWHIFRISHDAKKHQEPHKSSPRTAPKLS